MNLSIPSSLNTAIIIFRWAALFSGFVSIDYGSPNRPLFLQQVPQIIFFFLFVYHLAATLFLIKGLETRSGFLFLLLLDISLGVFLVYFYGYQYFLLAFFVPVLETAAFAQGGAIYTACISGALIFPLLVLQLVNMQARDFILKNLLVFAAMGGAATYILFRLSSVEKEKTELTERFHKDRRLAIEAFEEQQEEKKGFLERIEELHRELDSRKQALFQIQETQAQKSEETSREMEERSQRIERLETLLRALREFVPSPHLDELFSGFTEMLGNHLPLDTCVLFLPEEEEGKIRFMAELAVSNYVEYFKNYSVSPGEEAVGWVAVQKTPLLIAEGTHITPERQELSTILASEKSALLAPLMIQDELLGVLYVSHTKPSRYTPWDLEFLTHFTSLIAPALLLAHHYQQAVSTGVHDGVTGLYNNLYFRERLAEEFRRANRYEHPLSLIMVDVDRFQRFNASYGERFGDFLLRELGELLKGYLRDVDVCARLGNDQFAILLIQADKSNAILIAERIRLAIEMRAFGAAARQKVRITASMGVASFPQDARAKEDLLEKGAKSLAIAQKKGGNNTSFAA